MKNFNQSFFTTIGTTIKLAFSLITLFLLNSNCIFGQTPSNGGFENGTTNWTTTGAISTTNARTGVNSLRSASSSSTTNTAHTNANTVSVNPNKYGITIGWAKGSNTFSSASAGGTLLGTTGSSTTATIGTTLTRLTYASAQNVSGAGVTFSGRMNSRTSTANNATQVYFDDVIIYESTTATPDLTKPTAATAFTNGSISSSCVNFSWTAGSDAGTGIQRTIVLRTTNLSAATPVMNDQGIYSTLGSTAGPNLVGTDWTVMMTNGAATSLTYTDCTVTPGTSYKYAVVYRDLAYNYSAALVSGTINVPLVLSSDSKLSSLAASTGGFTFASETTSYFTTTTFANSTVTITAIPNQANATMEIKTFGGTYTSLANNTPTPLPLYLGQNQINVRVTAQNGTTQIVYSLSIDRLSNDATMSDFNIVDRTFTDPFAYGTFSPPFASGTFTGYSTTYPYPKNTVKVTAWPNSGATVALRINGGSYTALTNIVGGGDIVTASSLVSLNVGANLIDVRVTSEDGTTQNVYSCTVTRAAPSNDSSLSAFYITPLPLGGPTPVVTPTFASGTFSYSTTTVLPYSNSQVTVNASRNQSGASLAVRINGGSYWAISSSSYGPLNLNVGANIIDVRVTAEDGTTQSVYTLTVTRAGSPDATLSMLYTTAGTLSPSFARDTNAYTASVSNTTTSVTVTPCKNQANATVAVQVNSGGYSAVTSCTPSSGLSLNVGSNAIDVRVTAQDGTTLVTYTITVTRAAENSATTPTILTSGTLSAVNTTYGLASATPTSFNVSAQSLTDVITIAAPTGFEVSLSSESGYATTTTLGGTGNVSSTPVYVRLTAANAVGTYSGNITLDSTGATRVTIPTTSSNITQKGLTISGLTGVDKIYDTLTSATVTGTATLNGVVGSDDVTINSTAVTYNFANSTAGSNKPITVLGFSLNGTKAGNYSIAQPTSITATINKATSTIEVTGSLTFNYNGAGQGPNTSDIIGSAGAVTYNYTGVSPTVYGPSATKPTNFGSYTANATVAADTNYEAATSADFNFSIAKADQTITLAATDSKVIGAANYTLALNSSVGLAISYTSSNIGVASITGNIVTLVGAGTTTITASQAGDDNYNAATTAIQILTINSFSPIIYVKMNIEGFYDTTTHAMRSVIANQGVGSSSTDVDTVTIELHDATSYALVTSTTAMLQTNGIAVANFSTTAVGSYYLVVKHRNSLETWSALPYSFGGATTTYDFTSAANKAYGNNMIQLESGVYGFYSGDLNQDGFVESGDYPSLYNDSDAGLEGYYSTDLNGDGFVESGDYPILFNNSDSGIEISRP
jgi:hypothetical protein